MEGLVMSQKAVQFLYHLILNESERRAAGGGSQYNQDQPENYEDWGEESQGGEGDPSFIGGHRDHYDESYGLQ